jgi:predicted Zn finger-like uncharacterized protein
MIIVCQKCSVRLQIDETKVPSSSFTVRCPKCNSVVDSGLQSPATELSAIAVGGSPASENPRFDRRPKPAPLFELDQDGKDAGAEVSATDRLAELLTGLIGQSSGAGRKSQSGRGSWDPRKVLVCGVEDNRESIARGLAENGHQVFVAQDTRQAVDRMRENQLEVVVLDSRFDQVEQGNVFVTREVNILRPADRRRLFFVLLSPTLRTMDAHAAFLNNINAVVNINDIAELPVLIEYSLREYNELYKDFNSVIGAASL